MADALPSPAALSEPAPLRIQPELVLKVPLPMLRYRQRPIESGRLAGPDCIEGRGMPQDHVIHRTLAF